MSGDQGHILRDGLELAMQAEQEAARFYADAAARTADPRGRDLFQQLARFEQAHFTHLKSLYDGEFEGYQGEQLLPEKPEATRALPGEADRRSATDALTVAIKSEEKAAAAYRRLAGEATDERLRDFFQRLEREEELHRKVLEDQYLSLTNQGFWTWGE